MFKADTSTTGEENQPGSPVEDRDDDAGESHPSTDPGSSSVANKQEERLKRLGELRMRMVRDSWILNIAANVS